MTWLNVLMPVYNGADTLEATLESVASQADGIEVILVDQGSTDASAEIAAGFADRMPIKCISAPQNENWVQNTNLALEQATAPRATLLHQDDLWRPGRAAALKAAFEAAPDAALWVHAADYIDAKGRTVGQFAPPFGGAARVLTSDEALATLLVQNTIALPAAAFPTATAREIGGLDEALWYTADWDFWLKLAKRGDLAWSPERAAAFRLHRGSLTMSGSRDLDDFEQQLSVPLQRHADTLPAWRRNRAVAAAEASNQVNVWLASRVHRERRSLGPVLSSLVRLGPLHWGRFLRDTRLPQRILPRLALMKGRSG